MADASQAPKPAPNWKTVACQLTACNAKPGEPCGQWRLCSGRVIRERTAPHVARVRAAQAVAVAPGGKLIAPC